jgi:hypothetical protein
VTSKNPNDFDLPEEPGFISKPPRLSFEQCVLLSEEYARWAMRQPGFEEKRLAAKVTEEFKM